MVGICRVWSRAARFVRMSIGPVEDVPGVGGRRLEVQIIRGLGSRRLGR